MNECFDKARELGELILKSKEGANLIAAEKEYDEGIGPYEHVELAKKALASFSGQIINIMQATVFGIDGLNNNDCGACGKRGKHCIRQ